MFESVSRLIIAVCVPSILLRMKRQQFMRGVVLHFQAFELDLSWIRFRCLAGVPLQVRCGCLAGALRVLGLFDQEFLVFRCGADSPNRQRFIPRGFIFILAPPRLEFSAPALCFSMFASRTDDSSHGGVSFSDWRSSR